MKLLRQFKTVPGMLLCIICLFMSLGANSPKLDSEIPEISKQINEFSVDLLKHNAMSNNPPANMIISPQSIFYGLSMSYIASGGETKKELAASCHFPEDSEQLLKTAGTLRRELQKTAGHKHIDVSIANSLWLDETYADFSKKYIENVQEAFDASFHRVKFKQQFQASENINLWISEKTHGKIQRGVSPADFESRSSPGVIDEPAMVSVNAIYFKADWGSRFDKSATRKQPFHVDASRTVETLMMHQCSLLPYSENDEVKFLEIPYIDGVYSMYVILPKKIIPVKKLMEIINLGTVLDLKRNAFEREVDVLLPKFEMRSHLNLKKNLSEMGGMSAFDKQNADFDKMIVKNPAAFRIYLSEIYHDAWIDVDEEGTEAAAATSTVHFSIGCSAPFDLPPVQFHADHPFLFMIVHNQSRSILFAGWISDPEKLTQQSSEER